MFQLLRRYFLAQQHMQNVTLGSVPYFIGIASPTGSQNVTFSLSGKNCSEGTVGPNCEMPQALVNRTGTVNQTGQDFTYTFHVDKFYETLNFPVVIPEGTSKIYTSYMGTPVKKEGTETTSLIYPRWGNWNVLYELKANAADAQYTIMAPAFTQKCTNDSLVGPNCKELITVTTSRSSPASLRLSSLTISDEWDYYKVSLPQGEPLWVSVVSSSGTVSDNPNLYVKFGSLPKDGMQGRDYDYMNCNLPASQCAYANIINLNVTATASYNYTWYVGVQSPPGKNITYGIWFSTTCPPNCENTENESGTCVFSNNVGQCVCADGYSGLDCQTSSTALPTQYIVLIIIASLVVASAVIGFIAWAYMQRRREGYNPLS